MVRRYLVKGRVQGVGFRWYVQREAGTLGLRGWVRNTSAGHVEVLASGADHELHALYAALKRGPRGARVDTVEVHEAPEEMARGLKNFQIEGAW